MGAKSSKQVIGEAAPRGNRSRITPHEDPADTTTTAWKHTTVKNVAYEFDPDGEIHHKEAETSTTSATLETTETAVSASPPPQAEKKKIRVEFASQSRINPCSHCRLAPARDHLDEVLRLLASSNAVAEVGKGVQPDMSSGRALLMGRPRMPSTAQTIGAHKLVQRIVEAAVERTVDRVVPLERVVATERVVVRPRKKRVPRVRKVPRELERVTWERRYVYRDVEKAVHKEVVHEVLKVVEVPLETRRRRVVKEVPKIVYDDVYVDVYRPVRREREEITYVEKVVDVPKVVEVPVVREVLVEKVVEVEVPVVKTIERDVFVDRIKYVEKRVEVVQPDEIIELRVPVPREVIVEVEAVVELITPVVQRVVYWYVPTTVEGAPQEISAEEGERRGMHVPEEIEYVDEIEYEDTYRDVVREETVEVVREVEVEVEVPVYVEVEKRVVVEREVVEEEIVEIEQHVMREVERVIEVPGPEVVVEKVVEVPVEREVIVERKVDTPVERLVTKEVQVHVERIEYVDREVEREIIEEVTIEVPIKAKTVVKRIEEPFDVVREVVVQRVHEKEVVVETTDALPAGWGVVVDAADASGAYYYNRNTDERSDTRPGGELVSHGCKGSRDSDGVLRLPPHLGRLMMAAADETMAKAKKRIR